MRPHAGLVLTLFALAALGAPLALALIGTVRSGARPSWPARPSWDWRATAASTLVYVLAFNLVFITQELFLVIPKALTPGLHPVLYHNNHDWTGANPVARLFQGTGALAILIIGLAAMLWVTQRPPRAALARLVLVWTAFCGLFQSLPQLVAGAVLPGNDVGMAMDYLGLTLPQIWLAAGLAVVAMTAGGLALTRSVLELGSAPAGPAVGGMRGWRVFQLATLPALLGVLLILPFRAPGPLDQVAVVPVAATVLGLAWVQAGAWRSAEPRPLPPLRRPRLGVLVGAMFVVLIFFQLVLRRGIAF